MFYLLINVNISYDSIKEFVGSKNLIKSVNYKKKYDLIIINNKNTLYKLIVEKFSKKSYKKRSKEKLRLLTDCEVKTSSFERIRISV